MPIVSGSKLAILIEPSFLNKMAVLMLINPKLRFHVIFTKLFRIVFKIIITKI